MIQCPKCGAENAAGANFCTSCGTDLKKDADGKVFCTSCGVALKADAKFCHACGALQTTAAQREQVLQSTWKDIDVEKSTRRPARNMRATLLPMLLIPVLAAVFFLLSRTGQDPGSQANTTAGAEPQGQPGNMASMEQVFAQIDSLKKALTQNPQDTSAALTLGEMFEMAGKPAEAREYYLSYLKINSRNLDVRMRVANTYFNEKNYQGAQDELKKVIDLYPNSAIALYNYGLTLHLNGDPQGALASWEKAAQLDPHGEAGQHAREALDTFQKIKNKN